MKRFIRFLYRTYVCNHKWEQESRYLGGGYGNIKLTCLKCGMEIGEL